MPDLPVGSGDPPRSSSGLAALHLDPRFLKSRRGIILGSELILLLLMFICYAVSAAAFLTAPLIFTIINIVFFVVYAADYQAKLTHINWTCVDFLRAASSAVIFLILSIISAATSHEGGMASAAVFGFMLTLVLIYDAYDSYRTIVSDQDQHVPAAGESQSSNLDAE
ncbi:CKLF-like MARVEL transmembrane domain-containing protein 5 isoform X2 [Scyliorhinus canicula]|uniref:CKLF-like MARVEL transmembrane domain-containing protein 5 isoform X2 n=1 Tax=Scyliorhinus canicula TaxID=7830 RepID=UPI0018F5E546|nr:CKLF-like MARVEL transmembrane domain-containing protein 5 isoform X2 [Scyliorhinus canicula]